MKAPPLVEVVLSADQLARARAAGARRQAWSVERHDEYGFVGDGQTIHVQGCIGELAVAVWRGAPWVEFADRFQTLPDDVDGFQVRTTTYHAGRLIVHPDDPSGQVFILARIHELPTVLLAGWVWGHEAKHPDWWGTLAHQPDRPCYWVPNDRLHDLRTLP